MDTTWAAIYSDPSGVLGLAPWEFSDNGDGSSFARITVDSEDVYAWRVPSVIETPEALRGALAVGQIVYTGPPTLGVILVYAGQVEYYFERDHGNVYLFRMPPASVKTG